MEEKNPKKYALVGKEKNELLQTLASFEISSFGSSFSQELIHLIIRLWARAQLQKIPNAQEMVSEWVGISTKKLHDLITETYTSKKMAVQKLKKKKVTKSPKISKEILECVASKIRMKNKKGKYVSLSILVNWINKHFDINVSSDSLGEYLKIIGFQWKKSIRGGNIIETPHFKQLRRTYLQKKNLLCEKNILYLDETYVHQNHASQYSWHQGNDLSVGIPIGKG